MAAFELRNGTGQYPKAAQLGVGTTAQGMDAQTMLDYMGIIMDTEKLQNRSFTINLKLTDGDDYLLKIHHGVLLYYKDALSDEADLTISTPESGFLPSQAEIRKISTSSSPLKRAIRRCSKCFVTVWPLLTCISISSSRKKIVIGREKMKKSQ